MKNYIIFTGILITAASTSVRAQNNTSPTEDLRFTTKLGLYRAEFSAKQGNPQCTETVAKLSEKMRAYVTSLGLSPGSISLEAHINYSVIHRGQPFPDCQAIIDYSENLKIVKVKEPKIRGKEHEEACQDREEALLAQPNILKVEIFDDSLITDAIFRPGCEIESYELQKSETSDSQ